MSATYPLTCGPRASATVDVARHRTARATPEPRGPTSERQVLEVRPERLREVRPGERDLDRGLQPAHRGPRVVTRPLELVGADLLLLHQRPDPIRHLDLAIRAPLCLIELVEHLGRQHVPPHH